jgi:hypothetical protein
MTKRMPLAALGADEIAEMRWSMANAAWARGPAGSCCSGFLGKHVATSRQLLRKLLDRERSVFYPQRDGEDRWYEVAVKPTLDRFFAAVPLLKKAVASPTGFGTAIATRSVAMLTGIRRGRSRLNRR